VIEVALIGGALRLFRDQVGLVITAVRSLISHSNYRDREISMITEVCRALIRLQTAVIMGVP
jgi:hypothetical protein